MAQTTLPALIDIGANLAHDSFDADRDAVLGRAEAENVTRMIVTGADLEGSRRAHELASAHPGRLFATAGVHPHQAAQFSADTEAEIRTLASHKQACAVGETGLDYYRNLSPREGQLAAFEKQLALAVELQKPVFLHQREAHADFLALLKNVRDQLPGAVVHCFTDSRQALHDYLDLDCHIGITGWICDERRGTHLREFVHEIPSNRLMLETDAPYLMPRNLQPKPAHRRNEPMYLGHICREVARDRSEDAATTAANASATAAAFFCLEQAASTDGIPGPAAATSHSAAG